MRVPVPYSMSSSSLVLRLKSILLLLIVLVFLAAQQSAIEALVFSDRSVTISTAIPSATANHSFAFTYPSTNVVGSVVFEYCDNTPLITQPCTAPAGLDVSGASLTGQTGNVGFIISPPDTTANKIVITRAPVAALTLPSSYVFSSIINPSDSNHTSYVRISTYPTTNGSGPYSDNGSVAFATISQFEIGAFVPPFLKLCVAITVASNCSSMSGDSLDLGVLSASSTKFGTSQFSTGTNSITGYVVYVLGTTMTSGNNVIPALHPAGPSQTGNSQFGINLRANSIPSVGQEPSGAGTGSPQPGYDIPNLFNLQSGDSIAVSSQPTDFSRMTVSYVTNVGSGQPAGVYSTTLTYLAIADF